MLWRRVEHGTEGKTCGFLSSCLPHRILLHFSQIQHWQNVAVPALDLEAGGTGVEHLTPRYSRCGLACGTGRGA